MKSSTQYMFYPPVIAVLGHVDHGKTSLLDAIRKTNVASGEHGGITQGIGASSVGLMYEGKKRRITFVDTPGHEAFIRMRARGVGAADMGLLVVSSTDGVMPQTKESIRLLKDAKIPFIVVLTKSDLPDKNPQKTKQQLLKEEVLLEGLGGDVPFIEVSAKMNTNIKELLDLILLVFEMRQDKQSISEQGEFKAIVIESKLDPKSGPKATIVIKNGSLLVKDEISVNDTNAKVKSIINDKGERLQKATIGDAVEVLGFDKVPEVGGLIIKKRSSDTKIESNSDISNSSLHRELGPPEGFFAKEEKKITLHLVVCADTLGSLEAIISSLSKDVSIVLQKTGEVTPADILFAKSVGAIVVGFNIKVRDEIIRLASVEKVLFKNYTIIYELIDEINDALEGKQLKIEEEIFGKAKILASFPYEKTKVLGIAVLEGRAARGDKARLMRRDEVIGESAVSSVRMGKNIVSKVEKGREAGIILSPFLDFEIGDMLVFHA